MICTHPLGSLWLYGRLAGRKATAVRVFTTALLLGIVHAFGPDHLAAVSAFVSQRRRLGPALIVSLRWGIAHMTSVLLLGTLISAFSLHVPVRFEPLAEFAVGLVLVLVGVISLQRNFQAQKLHFHRHSHGSLVHSHLHTHASGEEHLYDHAVTLTGAIHGLAGAIPALALLPLAALQSPWRMGAYLLLFGLGVILGMTVYCLALSRFLRTLSEVHLYRWAQPVLGASSCALGIVWMIW